MAGKLWQLVFETLEHLTYLVCVINKNSGKGVHFPCLAGHKCKMYHYSNELAHFIRQINLILSLPLGDKKKLLMNFGKATSFIDIKI